MAVKCRLLTVLLLLNLITAVEPRSVQLWIKCLSVHICDPLGR